MNKYVTIPISVASKPRTALMSVYVDYYWLVTQNNEILIYSGITAQCNPDIEITKKLLPYTERNFGSSLEVRQIPLIFVPYSDHKWSS